MAEFPTKEADIVALVNQMRAGRAAHPADFPHWSGAPIVGAVNGYLAARDAQTQAFAAAKLATEEKNARLKTLVKVMKKKLRQCEVDAADDPQILAYLGWGPRTEPQPVAAPGQPENFRPTAEGPGNIWLEWAKPASGGAVRNYIIERRDQQETGSGFGAWSLVGSALNNEINLTGQPRGIQAEYRVKAANIAGESIASNTAAVVL